jgi:hypothetical protein
MSKFKIIEAAEGEALPEPFATYDPAPTLCVEVPEGKSLISCVTPDGRRITFAFLPYETRGVPECVDIKFHDNGTTQPNGSEEIKDFEFIAFEVGGTLYDSRRGDNRRTTQLCALLHARKG